MEKKNGDILDIIDEEIKEAYRCFDIGKKKNEAQQLKSSQMVKRRSRQVAQNLLSFNSKTLTEFGFSQRFVF